MEYKYAKNENFEDFASGRVIYHMGGEATFPVRLTLEIYERCIQYSNKKTDIFQRLEKQLVGKRKFEIYRKK